LAGWLACISIRALSSSSLTSSFRDLIAFLHRAALLNLLFSSFRSPLDGSRDLGRHGILDSSSASAAVAGSLAIPLRRAHSSFALISSASASSTKTAVGGRAGRAFSSEAQDIELRDLARLNSNLNLDLAEYQLDGVSNSNYSRIESDDDNEPILASHALDGERTPTPAFPHVIEPDDDNEDGQDADEDNSAVDNTSDSRADSHATFHITRNTIHQQLRSISQLSGQLSDSSEQPMPADTWTFHYRERSGNFLSASAIAVSYRSGPSLHVARERDASSSVYSRPTSPEADQAVPEPYELPADLAETAVGDGDWPLREKEDSFTCEQHVEGEGYSHTGEDAHITIVEPALPTLITSSSTPTLLLGSGLQDHVGKLSRAPSHKSGSSSTTKRSRFLERFTPPKKLVTKRRSIFKFLRAGRSRNQTRSTSTPALCNPHLRPYVDGPSDENEMITVQYELTPPETNPPRSVSLGNLAVPVTNESQGVASSPDLRRKPSLAEYERHLSIVGDDRRLPSTTKELNINRLSQIEEDEQHEHVSAKNSFSYHSKTQTTDSLMEAALERQLREKAMFRSASKRSIPRSEMSVTSFAATSWNEPSSLQPQSPDRDPLDSVGGTRPSASHLSPPRTPVESRSRNSSFVAATNQRPTASGKKPMILHTPSSISRSSIRSKIGSSLDSWSRYPSHTRGMRCASAGRVDNVRTLDFALDINHERIRGATDESDPFQPGSRIRVLTGKNSSRSKTKYFPKSRSATFGGAFSRYYSTLFSSPPDFHGKGRRTSVTIGGKLHRPELEILPPVLPPSSPSPISQSAVSYVHELEQLRPVHGSPLMKREQTVGSAGKGKSPVLSNKDIHHLQVSDGLDASRPPSFRGDSLFKPLSSEVPNVDERTVKARHETSQPDGSDDYFSARIGSSSKSNSQASLTITVKEDLPTYVDGTVETVETEKTPATRDPTKRSTPILTPSKSQAWSELYQECLVVTPSPVNGDDEDEAVADNPKINTMLPPPTPLSNTKLRSPATSLNPPAATRPTDPTNPTTTASTATIRRYPSVTVIDDRKGHWRSVSFISVQSGKSGKSGIAAAGSRAGSRAESFVREGSGDFLKLMEGREREERERLLRLGLGLV
jgi:hypothetical protein